MQTHHRNRMFRTTLFALIVSGLAVTFSAHASGVSLYMQIEGINGESTAVGHTNWIDVDTISWGVSRQDTTRTGINTFQDLVWTQVMDKSSPKVFEDLVNATLRPTITIDFMTDIAGTPTTFFNMEFRNTHMTNFELAGTTGELPMVAGAFNFELVRLAYSEFDSNGRLKGVIETSWSLDEGSAVAVSGLFGLALLGPQVVPVPGAVWLFSSGILALVGFGSRRK